MRNIVIALSLLLLLPLFGSGSAVSCQAQGGSKRVVVLDAGHGNPRPGKVQKQVREADYVLDVAKEVRNMLAKRAESLDVYLTRSCDSSYHAAQSTDNRMRAEFANKKGADLYVSIHANAHDKTSVNGCEVWVLTLNEKLMSQNDNVGTRYADEGDFIDAKDLDRSSMGFMMALARQLENEPYSRYFAEECCKNISKYGLKNLGVKAGPVFTVLYYFEGPGVIVELGYLTNDDDYKYLTSKNAKTEMATAITDAIISYFKVLDDRSSEVLVETVQETVEEAVEEPTKGKTKEQAKDKAKEQAKDKAKETAKSEVKEPAKSDAKELAEGYTIQLMSSVKSVNINDSQFKSYKGKVRELIGSGNYKYKYCYGAYTNISEAKSALKEVKESFKDAYVVCFKGNEIIKK